jgi:hypothetical protein
MKFQLLSAAPLKNKKEDIYWSISINRSNHRLSGIRLWLPPPLTLQLLPRIKDRVVEIRVVAGNDRQTEMNGRGFNLTVQDG